MKLNFANGLKTFKSVVTANSPVLLVGTAVVGVVATGVLAARGGYKARGIVDKAAMEADLEGGELTQIDKAKLTWLCYAAPALTGASTIASIIGVHTIHTKRHAALAGVLAVTTTKLDDMKDEAEELLGIKKTQNLRDNLAQKAVDRTPFEDNEVIITGDGTQLCLDEWTGRYFTSSIARLDAAVNYINKKLVDEGEASLNDYYDHLGLSPIEMGLKYGWSGVTLEHRVGSALTTDGRPVISVSFHNEPKENMGVRR